MEEQAKTHGMDPPPHQFGPALDQIFAGVDMSGVESACSDVDPELWTLIQQLRGIADNDEFRNVAGTFKIRALAAMSRGKSPQSIMDSMEAALSVEAFKSLVILLKHSGAL